ncbi:hypothetical protein BDD12DRAFT_977246 [Trichophaea hybrida]|nr:hypothetical protein BDD12DRAFT_977246 [Trichophaea hybrida]
MSADISDHEIISDSIHAAMSHQFQNAEMRIIIYHGIARPPLPAQGDANSELWAVPREAVISYEACLLCFFCSRMKIVLINFWSFYAKRHSIFYICVLQEENLPPYPVNAAPPPSTPRRQGQGAVVNRPPAITVSSVSAFMNAIGNAHVFLDTPIGNPEADKIAFIKCQSYNHQGVIVDQEGILIRQGHSLQDLHDKIRRSYSMYKYVPEELTVLYLEMRWGPEETKVHPSGDSARVLVAGLPNRETYVMKVTPVCTPSV